MCYAKPGPRCSGHAQKKLDRVTADLKDHYDRVNEDRAPEEGAAYWAQRSQLEAELEVAKNEFDTTPAGMKVLKAEMARIVEVREGGTLGTFFDEYETRLGVAQEVRASQLAAYKAKYPNKPPTQEETGETEESEAAALAPAPLCQCIEYKYNSECQHAQKFRKQADTYVIKNGHDASIALHEASSEFRKAEAALHEAQRGSGTAMMGFHTPEQMSLKYEMEDAAAGVHSARLMFFATPAGADYINHQIATGESQLAAHAPDGQGGWRPITWEQMQSTMPKIRQSLHEQYETFAKQPMPTASDNNQAPDLMYGNGCPQKCHEFKWSGNCTHMSPAQTVQQPSQRETKKAMNEALDKSGYRTSLEEAGIIKPKRGLLRRLTRIR